MQTDGRVRGGLVTDASGVRVLICTARLFAVRDANCFVCIQIPS